MIQTRAMSAVEALANVAIGWLVALATQLVVFPAVGLQATVVQNLSVSGAFTAVSLIRSYAVRRMFEAIARRQDPGGRVNPCVSEPGTGGPAAFLRGHNSNWGSHPGPGR